MIGATDQREVSSRRMEVLKSTAGWFYNGAFAKNRWAFSKWYGKNGLLSTQRL